MTGTHNCVGPVQMDVLQLAQPRDGVLGLLAERDDLSPYPPPRRMDRYRELFDFLERTG